MNAFGDELGVYDGVGGRLAQEAGPALGGFEIWAVQDEFFGGGVVGCGRLHALRVAAVAYLGETVADYYLEIVVLRSGVMTFS